MRFLSVALLVALSSPALSQSGATTPEQPVIRVAGAFFALSVADLEASTRWYREKLGLTVIMQAARTEQSRSSVTVLQGGGLTVELVRHDDAVPLRTLLPQGRGALYAHGIFKVGMTVDDFDGTLAALRARGVDIAMGPWPKRADQPANVIIRDNAGNYIQLFGR